MHQQTQALVTRVDSGAISYLTLNRPTAGNSLSLDTIDALHRHLIDLRAERSISVIVLAGTGSRIFCAGHDMREFLDDGGTPEFSKEVVARCSAMMLAFRDQPQIIISKVDGVATAAGCQLVANSDLAIASSTSRFATPGVNIGLWCYTPQVALSRAVSPKNAFMMLATGKLFDADYALRAGLINQVVEADQLDDTIADLAGVIASKSSYALSTGKQTFYRQLQMSVADAYEYVGEVHVRNMAHPDAMEGIGAFIGKRPAAWKGR